MLAVSVGEWASIGAAVGVIAASLAALLTAWKLLDRVVVAIRGVVREEQEPLRDQVNQVQTEVTEIRDEQRDHIDYALRRDARLDEHSEKLGQLDERVSRLEAGE